MPDKDDVSEFRGVVEVMAVVAEKLAPYCSTVGELVGMLKHGLDNDAQLKLLMKTVREQPKR